MSLSVRPAEVPIINRNNEQTISNDCQRTVVRLDDWEPAHDAILDFDLEDGRRRQAGYSSTDLIANSIKELNSCQKLGLEVDV